MSVGEALYLGVTFEGWFDELIIHREVLPPSVIALRALAMSDSGAVFAITSSEAP